METIKLKLKSGVGVFNDPISEFSIANKQVVEVEESFGESILARCKGIVRVDKKDNPTHTFDGKTIEEYIVKPSKESKATENK